MTPRLSRHLARCVDRVRPEASEPAGRRLSEWASVLNTVLVVHRRKAQTRIRTRTLSRANFGACVCLRSVLLIMSDNEQAEAKPAAAEQINVSARKKAVRELDERLSAPVIDTRSSTRLRAASRRPGNLRTTRAGQPDTADLRLCCVSNDCVPSLRVSLH